MRTRTPIRLLVAPALVMTLFAQGSPTFEVSTVKRNKSGVNFVSTDVLPGGRYTATNAPLEMLIGDAYEVRRQDVIGLPAWADTDGYDIVASGEGLDPASVRLQPRLRLMIQALLAERFKLVAHREQRVLPVYTLVLARSDGKLGADLVPSTLDCEALRRARVPNTSAGLPSPPIPGCGSRRGNGTMTAGDSTIGELVDFLIPTVQRQVLDRTGLTGRFRMSLSWAPDRGGQPAPDSSAPSIFTAIQEQLGLRLQATEAPVEVLVIDRAERPVVD